jgi:hypothetical protein
MILSDFPLEQPSERGDIFEDTYTFDC